VCFVGLSNILPVNESNRRTPNPENWHESGLPFFHQRGMIGAVIIEMQLQKLIHSSDELAANQITVSVFAIDFLHVNDPGKHAGLGKAGP
jgi:hypothetical protein